MSSRRSAQSIYASLKDILKRSLQRFKAGLAGLLWIGRRRSRVAGFVLPTTVLLLLVVGLTVATLLLRAGVRTNQVIGQNQQRVIYNAATPAIDRARAKLETLFSPDGDPRYPGGVPSENYLAGMLRNDGSYGVPTADSTTAGSQSDRYTLPDETRVNLDGVTKTGEITPQDNAWVFRTDSNGDGQADATVVYSILLKTPASPAQLLTESDETKAGQLWVRRGPLSNEQRASCSVKGSPEGGWFQDISGTAVLRKPFQVNALVIPDTANQSGNFTTLEFQQDRQLDRGNKWGAWFRNDLEIFPFPPFNWNGAMHSEGSLIMTSSNGFNAYLVSAPESCLMSNASNSEISVTAVPAPPTPTDPPQFTGLTAVGSIRDNAYTPGGGVNIHVWPATNAGPSQNEPLTIDNHSANQTNNIDLIALDPVKLLTEDVSQSRVAGSASNATNFRPNPGGTTYQFPDGAEYPRITNKQQPKPFVDDLYRADNRWGPKPRYSDKIVLSGAGQAYGNLITTGNVTQPDHFSQMTNTPDDGADQIGLDGYWERRARAEGLRVIVGQRLELGTSNSTGWEGAGSPLYPPATVPTSRVHESLQRRALRDNLAAVQSTAIYHAANPNGRDLPVACLASTAHPGTAQTLRDSLTFNTTTIGTAPTLITDFLRGKGTNGWEFAWPYATEATFAAAIAPTQPLGRALRNLAQFAGDHDPVTGITGAFPPTQAAAGGVVHPYPLSTMWGNFSELRRTLARLDGGVAYTDPTFSPAEKTTLHTATCTLGMLAYNLQNVYADAAANPADTIKVGLRNQVDRDRELGFATGSSPTTPKYPALYYLFPKTNHGHNTSQPGSEPYIADPYITTTLNPTNPTRYQALVTPAPANPATYFAGVAIQPRSRTFTGTDGSGAWVLPYATTLSNIPGANVSTNRITAPNGNSVAVGFLDRVIMNGREMMPARVMDLDIGMLRSRGINGQPWLPVSGIVYAFREDAVREDAIARPAGTGGMNLATLPGTDPALVMTSKNISVSTKQVDYRPDPDRRIHGFRLRNGAQVKRNDSFGIPAANNTRGITFVSDNPTYIQGNFNLHQTGADDTVGTRLEEFTQTLPDAVYNEAQFYNRTTIEPNFAQAGDRWRPSEILADAVTILSDNFCDGSLWDIFQQAGGRADYNQAPLFGPGCANNSPTSFLNFNRPNAAPAGGGWRLEDGTTIAQLDQASPVFPVLINRNGRPVQGDGTEYSATAFSTFSDARPLAAAADTRVNTVLVGGLVPSRFGQSYGGLHNFPRFLEAWRGVNMWFAGSFLQLNFSNYATAPLDQDAWEVSDTPTPGLGGTNELLNYYTAPTRLWGYDPGLQLAPASPALARFITLNRQRTESYNELPMNDPYIQRLCQAAKTSGITQVANLNCPA